MTSLNHLPDLHDVVFRHRTNNPRFILVPGKVGDLGRVAAMNELHKQTHIHAIIVPVCNHLNAVQQLTSWQYCHLLHDYAHKTSQFMDKYLTQQLSDTDLD